MPGKPDPVAPSHHRSLFTRGEARGRKQAIGSTANPTPESSNFGRFRPTPLETPKHGCNNVLTLEAVVPDMLRIVGLLLEKARPLEGISSKTLSIDPPT